MPDKNITLFPSGTYSPTQLIAIGDPNTGQLFHIPLSALPTGSGLTASNALFAFTASYAPGYLTTASFNIYSSSYVSDSASFNNRISSISLNISGNFVLTSSFNTYTSSTSTIINNIFASESNYTPTSSFIPVSSSLISVSASLYTVSSSDVNTSASLNTAILNVYASESKYLPTSSLTGVNQYYGLFINNTQISTGSLLQSGSVVLIGGKVANPQINAPLQILGNILISGSIYDSTNNSGSLGNVLTLGANGLLWTVANFGQYVLTSSFNTFTGSFNTFSGSYVIDSGSFNNRINTTNSTLINVYASQSNYVPTGSISGSTGYLAYFSGSSYISSSYIQQTPTQIIINPSLSGSFGTGIAFIHGYGNTVSSSGYGAHAEGSFNLAVGYYSHAEGTSNTSSGTTSHAEGNQNSVAGASAHVEGAQNVANGTYSHAEGYKNTIQIGSTAVHAEGFSNIVTGSIYAHVEGSSNSIYYANIAHVEGQNNVVSNIAAHAEGYLNSASGQYSHAEGQGTIAFGTGSHAAGLGTIAYGNYQNVVGQYNNLNNATSLFIVGNGTGPGTTSDLALFDPSSVSILGALNVSGGLHLTGALYDATGNPGAAGYVLASIGNSVQWITGSGGTGSIFVSLTSLNSFTSSYFTGDSSSFNIRINNVYASESNYLLTSSVNGNAGYLTLFSSSRVLTSSIVQQSASVLIVSNSYGFIHGFGNTVNLGAHAEGFSTIASGQYSHAEGGLTYASGSGSHAEGYNNYAYIDYSHAEGFGSSTYGTASHAEGYSNSTYAIGSHAEGFGSSTYGQYAHAEGYSNNAIGQAAHAEGFSTIASGSYSHAEGFSTIASGSYSHAEGYQTQVIGQGAHAEGYLTIVSGQMSHAEGFQTQVIGQGAHAEGYLTNASGSYSHVEGQSTIAFGSASHAEGQSTIAFGQYSHAEGFATLANGVYSHAEGYLTTGSGSWSHAEGSNTLALGNYSHAEGQSTFASGAWSHAEGSATSAIGIASHAGGYGTVASGNYQTVVGQFNNPNNTSSLFIIGNGTGIGAFTSDLALFNTSSINFYARLNISGGLSLSGSLYDISGSSGINGYVLGSINGKPTWISSSLGGGGTGSVVSVGLQAPSTLFYVSGSPVTLSGSLNFNLVTQSVNTVFAAPTSSNGNPSFRQLVPADISGSATAPSGAYLSPNGWTVPSASATGSVPYSLEFIIGDGGPYTPVSGSTQFSASGNPLINKTVLQFAQEGSIISSKPRSSGYMSYSYTSSLGIINLISGSFDQDTYYYILYR